MNISQEGLRYIAERSELEDEAAWAISVKKAEDTVNNWVVTELSQEGFDALVSLAHSIGSNNFKKSTVLRLLNKGQIEEAANGFEDWIYVGEHKDLALVNRRSEEKEMFLRGELQPLSS